MSEQTKNQCCKCGRTSDVVDMSQCPFCHHPKNQEEKLQATTEDWENKVKMLCVKIARDAFEREEPIVNDEMIHAFINSLLQNQRDSFVEMIKSKKKKTCNCEDDIGYHGKECDMEPFGYNQALQDILDSLT